MSNRIAESPRPDPTVRYVRTEIPRIVLMDDAVRISVTDVPTEIEATA